MSSRIWRLIHSGPGDAATNMAVDDALLQSVADGVSGPVLRVYRWHPSAFSCGVFQDPAVVLNVAACRAQGVGLVRRPTGGGVLAHDGDVSYAVICRVEDLGRMSVASSYAFLNRFLLTLYRTFGRNVEMSDLHPACAAAQSPRTTGFCGGSLGPADILVDGRKLGGTAQRRRGGALLQHGSIPLRSTVPFTARYSAVPVDQLVRSVCCLNDILATPVDAGLLSQELVRAVAVTYGISLERSALTEEERCRAEVLIRTVYGTDSWNFLRRSAPSAMTGHTYVEPSSLA